MCLWDKLAARYGKYSDFVAFDLLNEIVDPDVAEIWNALALRAVERIRRVTKETDLLIGGARYNSIMSVKDLILPPDEHIVYSFHCYEPILFTHQGAYWVDGMPEDFRIGYPLDTATCKELSKKMMPVEMSDILDFVASDAQGKDFFLNLFRPAVKIAEERNVALYCGEYGVIDRADPADTVRWYEAIHAAFTELGIGRAMWTYKALDFGLMDEHYAGVRKDLIALL